MSKEEREDARRAAHRVQLTIVVTDAFGRTVKGLSREDFTVLDQYEPQRIDNFQAVDGSSSMGKAHIVVLLDSLNNTFQEVARQRRAINAYLQLQELPYPVSLALLSDSGLRRIDPSQDGKLLAKELQESFPRPGRFSFNGGPSGGNQRFLLSIQALREIASAERDVPGRAILIWLGQGWPKLTDPGYEAATLEDKKSYFDTSVQLATSLREAQIMIDNVASPAAELNIDNTDQAFLEGIHSPQQADARDLSLPVLVHQSGGRLLNRDLDLASQIVQCVLDAGDYYRLSFDPSPASKPNELRSIEVRVSQPGMIPRTNTLYYAQP